jgi:hypothetical protein
MTGEADDCRRITACIDGQARDSRACGDQTCEEGAARGEMSILQYTHTHCRARADRHIGRVSGD